MAHEEQKFAHTPGPWGPLSNSPYDDGTPYYRLQTSEGAHFDSEKQQGFGHSEIMGEADAKLIIGAPMIFGALVNLVDCLRLGEQNDDCPGWLINHPFLQEAEAAIWQYGTPIPSPPPMLKLPDETVWTKWSGGDPPADVDPEQQVEVLLKNESREIGKLRDFYWTHSPDDIASADIVAFRLLP